MRYRFNWFLPNVWAVALLVALPVLAVDPPSSLVVNTGTADWVVGIRDYAAPVGNLKIYLAGQAEKGGEKLKEISNRWTSGEYTLEAGQSYDFVVIPSPMAKDTAIALTLGFKKSGKGDYSTINIKQLFAHNAPLPGQIEAARDYLKYLNKPFFSVKPIGSGFKWSKDGYQASGSTPFISLGD
jgi:hypothetical protein